MTLSLKRRGILRLAEVVHRAGYSIGKLAKSFNRSESIIARRVYGNGHRRVA